MKMTKLFNYLAAFLLVGGTLTSCLDDEVDADLTSYGFLPVVDVTYSEDSIQPVSQPTNIHVTFNYTNTCQNFIEFQNISTVDANETKLGVFARQDNGADCTISVTPVTKTYQFRPRVAGPNVVKFWAGKDPSGTDLYIIDTINVPQ